MCVIDDGIVGDGGSLERRSGLSWSRDLACVCVKIGGSGSLAPLFWVGA